MPQLRWHFFVSLALALLLNLWLGPAIATMTHPPQLLTDPFLQFPSSHSVRVVWFTEFAGIRHQVTYGQPLNQTASATTTQLSRTREDADSKLSSSYPAVTDRRIWRHEAEVTLPAQTRLPYRVTSVREDGATVTSAIYTLAAKPAPGQPLKILLTSDHQLKPMAAANLQKVVETVGQVDGVFFAGDLVNVPDRASEWFDDRQGGAFFPVLQGRANYELEKNGVKTRYQGGAVIQHAPLYPAIGNHEVMGRFSSEASLNSQFGDPIPRQVAQALYQPPSDSAASTSPAPTTWIKNHSFNTDTYEEIFSLPPTPQGKATYYAESFGDVRLVVLYITNVWRSPYLDDRTRGKYREAAADLENPANWGYGQHIFESIAPGSPQYVWLEQELQSSAFQQAKYKIVMFHHPPHSLGENIVPAYTDPVQKIETDISGQVTAIKYEYPQSQDYITQAIVPLLEQAGVQLVFYGHSHLWNRFTSPTGMHFLETSNVGNSYGAYVGTRQRQVPTTYQESYAATGNPNGLAPVIPTIAPLQDASGQPLAFIASNEITVFSILDTGNGSISSYRFDTTKPASPVVKFDQFTLQTERSGSGKNREIKSF